MAHTADSIQKIPRTKPRSRIPEGYLNPSGIKRPFGRIDPNNDRIEIRNEKNEIHSINHSQNNSVFQNQIAIGGIDDSLVVDFSLEKFKAVRFSARKKISLFFEHTFPYFVQSMFVPIFSIIYYTLFDLKIHGKENLKKTRGPMLFISNHISFYDSFIFDLFVHPFSHILPFRFMGSRVFIVPFLAVLKLIGVVDLVYLLFGVFRITPGEGAEKSLKHAYEIVKRGGTVAMYPEGRIWHPTNVHPEEIGPFKWGAGILAKNTGVQVVPVAMKRTVVKGAWRTKLDVYIGRPYHVNGEDAPEVIAEKMRKKVVELYEGRE